MWSRVCIFIFVLKSIQIVQICQNVCRLKPLIRTQPRYVFRDDPSPDEVQQRHPNVQFPNLKEFPAQRVWGWTRDIEPEEPEEGWRSQPAEYLVFESPELRLMTLVRFPSCPRLGVGVGVSRCSHRLCHHRFSVEFFESKLNVGKYHFIDIKSSSEAEGDLERVVTIGNTHVGRESTKENIFNSFEFMTETIHGHSQQPFVMGAYFQMRNHRYYHLRPEESDSWTCFNTNGTQSWSSGNRWASALQAFSNKFWNTHKENLSIAPNKSKMTHNTLWNEKFVEPEYKIHPCVSTSWFVGNHIISSGIESAIGAEHSCISQWHLNPFEQHRRTWRSSNLFTSMERDPSWTLPDQSNVNFSELFHGPIYANFHFAHDAKTSPTVVVPDSPAPDSLKIMPKDNILVLIKSAY